jgi:hypothetical protein
LDERSLNFAKCLNHDIDNNRDADQVLCEKMFLSHVEMLYHQCTMRTNQASICWRQATSMCASVADMLGTDDRWLLLGEHSN